jgi:hypothetical protein
MEEPKMNFPEIKLKSSYQRARARGGKLLTLGLVSAGFVFGPEAIQVGSVPMGSAAFGQQVNPANNPVNVDEQRQMQTLAVVNGEPVTRQQIANECLRRFGKQVLESIVKKQLVFNECERRGVIITEKDVNDEIAAKAKSLGFSTEKYIELITSRRNISLDRLRNDIVWEELALRRLAANEIAVTPEEIQKQIEFEYGPKVQVREIVCESAERAEQINIQSTQIANL